MASVAAHLDPTWERGSWFNKNAPVLAFRLLTLSDVPSLSPEKKTGKKNNAR
ncbi:uncharacterized protein TrAFT101_008661 [Trichoderma asperellum]|uniref:uncharacterized protein n=1 Tax=Trichoderma asperellum TaxID=101201 RepID=UPI00332C045D|nr:hypothetical protein TrAFT101_008661 [Trichoderma asperellum]